MAPAVARIMAKEMDKDEAWINEEVKKFNAVANNYVIKIINKMLRHVYFAKKLQNSRFNFYYFYPFK